ILRRHGAAVEPKAIRITHQAGHCRAHLCKRLPVSGHPLLGKLDLDARVNLFESLDNGHATSVSEVPLSIRCQLPIISVAQASGTRSGAGVSLVLGEHWLAWAHDRGNRWARRHRSWQTLFLASP